MSNIGNWNQRREWLLWLEGIRDRYPFGPLQIIKLDDQIHCTTGPAYISPTRIKFYREGKEHGPDIDIYGTVKYYFKGILVPDFFFLEPAKITPEYILEIENVEVRLAAIEIIGHERFEPFLEKIQSDKFGTIFRIPQVDSAICLKVINSTPEIDGTYKAYYLYTPPFNTAHEAVAWTFDMTAEEYNPTLET